MLISARSTPIVRAVGRRVVHLRLMPGIPQDQSPDLCLPDENTLFKSKDAEEWEALYGQDAASLSGARELVLDDCVGFDSPVTATANNTKRLELLEKLPHINTIVLRRMRLYDPTLITALLKKKTLTSISCDDVLMTIPCLSAVLDTPPLLRHLSFFFSDFEDQDDVGHIDILLQSSTGAFRQLESFSFYPYITTWRPETTFCSIMLGACHTLTTLEVDDMAVAFVISAIRQSLHTLRHITISKEAEHGETKKLTVK